MNAGQLLKLSGAYWLGMWLEGPAALGVLASSLAMVRAILAARRQPHAP